MKSIVLFFVTALCAYKKKTLTCNEEQIENCLECGTGELNDTCAKCENNYFPFLFNYLCLPCDHMTYGDSGCQGNCYIDDSLDLTCDEFGCKEGFYSIDKKTCVNCNSFNSLYCAKCSNLPPEGKTALETDQRIFQCNECISNQYRIQSDGKCRLCRIRNCASCHYLENSNKAVCDICDYDYYVRNGNCIRCGRSYINNGYCRICTDDPTDYDHIYCYCNSYYTHNTPRTCVRCPNSCSWCTYDQSLGRTRCRSCFRGFAVNSQGYCTYCGIGCLHCSINSNGYPICSFCGAGYNLINGTCYNCPSNCEKCHYENGEFICDKCFNKNAMNSQKKCFNCPAYCEACKFNTNDVLICTSCYTSYRYDIYYALNSNSLCQRCPSECRGCFWKDSTHEFGCYGCYYRYALKDDKCWQCPSRPELGTGCDTCFYDKTQDKFQCSSCVNRNYAYVSNTYECKINTNPSDLQLYGCLRASYNYETSKYECYTCKPEFIPILNDKNCRLPQIAGLKSDCREANNIGNQSFPIYSCLSCKRKENVNVTDYRGANDCYERINELVYCLKAIKDIEGNLQCIKCIGNFKFIFSEIYNKTICDTNCEFGYFKKHFWCHKCDDKKIGNPGCVAEKGCEYFSSNDQLNCNECKVGYFNYTYGQCFQCKEGSPPCLECHMNMTKNRFECDKCIDGYYVNNEKKCEIITCDEHPEVTPGCIICIDKLSEFRSKGICQACKEGYFKTKEQSCIYCKAKKNGGPACEICEYATDEDGNETNDIICKHCPNGFLTSDGKCYRCQDELENGCQNCTLQVDEIKKTEKLVCTDCFYDYLLSNHSHCIHFNSYANRIPYCSYQSDNLYKYIIEDKKDETFTEMPISTTLNDNEEEKEEFNYNNTNNTKYEYKISSYCKSCKEGYILSEQDRCLPLDISNCSFLSFISFDSNNKTKVLEDYYDDYSNYINEENFYDKASNYVNEVDNYANFHINYENYEQCKKMCYGSKYVQIEFYYEVSEEVKIYNKNKTNYSYDTDYPDEKDYSENIDYNDQKEYADNNDENNNGFNDKTEYTNNEDNYDNDSTNYYNENNTEEIVATEMRTIKYRFYPENAMEEGIKILENIHKLNILSKGYTCLSNLGTGDKFSPENLRKCSVAEYLENNDTYTCKSCVSGYSLDEETKTCKQSIKVSMNLRPGISNCAVKRIGNSSNPIYSCSYCYNRNNLLVTSDTGAKFCAPKQGELAGCTEVYANTTYLNDVYNCTNCDLGYISYYNIFFEKIMCQNIREKPIKLREIDSTIFNDVENVDAINGVCENSKLFTPDGIKCYACNNRTVGMVGCKGSCTFNLKRNISLKCEDDKCKTGYIEKTRGVCEPCETINDGCIECHYENSYLNGYYGFKRKRRFSCDQCDNGYLLSEDGTCHHCSTLGFTQCKKCGIDPKHDNELVCLECQQGYFVNKEGKCIYCSENQIRGKENTCITCDDVEGGGIEGCQMCKNVNNEPQCIQCKEGFILLGNNYTCLRISSNVELEELTHCQIVLWDNNHFECNKCEDKFVLLYENDDIKCFYENFIPTLNPNLCELFINMGTEDKPKFSCTKCKEEHYNEEKYGLSRITYQENNTAFCEYRTKYSSLENCTEAIMIIENGVIKLNCSDCIEDNILYYHVDTDLNICKYKYFEKQCVVKYCKTCVPGNNYFCSECLPSNYEVSPLTGGCVRKTDKVPAVYFKDIFRLKMNQYKKIGGRVLFGPFLSMRGLTNSQINTGHAFLVLLSFKLHYTRNLRNRNLEEEKTIKTYCQIVESCDETTDEANIADFDCIGDTNEDEDLSDYELNGIKESTENNTNLFQESNLDELVEKTDLKNLDKKEKTTFELKNFVATTTFSLDEFKDIICKDYHFDFTLNGKINRELKKTSFDVKLPINQIKNKYVNCNFNIKENRTADLKCDFSLKEYKNDYSEFSFKVTSYETEDMNIYFASINEVKLISEPKKKKSYLIIIIVVSIVVLLCIGIGIRICFLKRKSNKDKDKLNMTNNTNNIENNQNFSYNTNKNLESKDKVLDSTNKKKI